MIKTKNIKGDIKGLFRYYSKIIKGKGNISASILADSINKNKNRLTTFELEYPRFIHSEFMTHRQLSRNAASSRAIPVTKMIDNIVNNTAMPIHWGRNKKGMKADIENNLSVEYPSNIFPYNESTNLYDRELVWNFARDNAIEASLCFSNAKYHKQIVNRLTEPFQMIKVICTATEYDNFFYLRCHTDAQPEIKELATIMYELYNNNKPKYLHDGDWHLPYIDDNTWNECVKYFNEQDLNKRDINKKSINEKGLNEQDLNKKGLNIKNIDPLEYAKKVSASCCAQVSYRNLDLSIPKALNIYNMLVQNTPVHASPFEHQATPITQEDIKSFNSKTPNTHITHVDSKNKYWSGNFKGWTQYRQLIPHNTFTDSFKKE